MDDVLESGERAALGYNKMLWKSDDCALVRKTAEKFSDASKIIVAQIARKRATLMKPQKTFNCEYFSDLIDYITLSTSGKVILHTKVGTDITEGDEI